MCRRILLQKRLEKIAGEARVYFQPPASVRMKYPCIMYELSRTNVRHADDEKYAIHLGYTATVIDKNPESPIAAKMESVRYCSFDRAYVKDNLYHYVFTIYD